MPKRGSVSPIINVINPVSFQLEGEQNFTEKLKTFFTCEVNALNLLMDKLHAIKQNHEGDSLKQSW